MQNREQQPAKRIGDVLAAYLSKTGLARELGASSIQEEWNKVVGAEVASHTRVASFKAGTLRIEVDSAPWLHDLSTFYKSHLLSDMKARLNGMNLRSIEFRIGRFQQD